LTERDKNRILHEIVNSALTSEKQSSLPLKGSVSRLLPLQNKTLLPLSVFVPLLLLLLTAGISFLKPVSFTKYLPFLEIGVSALCFRYKTVGLWVSYFACALFLLIFFSDIPVSDRLWQMSLLFALALTLFILLLTLEEIEGHITLVQNQLQESSALSHQRELTMEQVKKSAEEREREFREEIERLKQEAELRRIDKIQTEKRCTLVQEEIELLICQKKEFIDEAREARGLAAHHLGQLEEQKEQFEKRISQLENELVDAKQAAVLPTPKEEPQEKGEKDRELQGKLARTEILYNELRKQFAQKGEMLSRARQELFSVQSKLLTREKEGALRALEPHEEAQHLEKEITLLVEEVRLLEEEITHLEGLVTHLLAIG
jgi:hypothetical protein